MSETCARCTGYGWTGPKDSRPGATCDDCSGTGRPATASSPRPAGSDACQVCGFGKAEHVGDGMMLHDFRPAARDTTGGELRDVLARAYPAGDEDPAKSPEAWAFADAVLALPALRDLLAERDKLAAQVRAVEGLAEELEAGARKLLSAARLESESTTIAKRMRSRGLARQTDAQLLRRALGTPTTGGGE